VHAKQMRKHECLKQLDLDLLATSPTWSDLPTQTRAEVLQLIIQILRESVAQRRSEAADE
jgi:hypothetical protein